MNERIQELAEQAWRATSDEVAHLNRIHNRSYSQDEITDIFEIKFAELIIRECMKVAVFKDDGYISTADVAGYMAAGRSTAAKMIKEHFGVEE